MREIRTSGSITMASRESAMASGIKRTVIQDWQQCALSSVAELHFGNPADGHELRPPRETRSALMLTAAPSTRRTSLARLRRL